MNSFDLASLTEFAGKYYNDEQISFCTELYNEAGLLKLEDKSKISAFLINTPVQDDSIKKLISDKFSDEVAENIGLLNRIGKVTFAGIQKNVTSLRKLFIELSSDISIIIIKLAERLVQLRTADRSQSSNIFELSEECLYFYSAIAQMLGIRKISNEMEDIAFKNLFPKDFEFLQKSISDKAPVYNSKLSGMRNELTKFLTANKIPFRLQSRIKRPYSIYRKLKARKITLDSIFDLLALRIITDSIENCYLSLGIVHSKWVPIDGRFKDWISYPKTNGYRSIQTTVHTRTGDKFEIQIRTEEMHQEAEYGSSAHWSYKQNVEASSENWMRYLRDFLENDEYFENPAGFFDFLKSEMKRDYINVLTPKGEIRSLPEGSTPVDYAFTVHTDLGYKIIGARINGKFTKLRTTLKSGDVIEVISAPNASPSRDWLNFVKTTRARSKIMAWFKKNERELYLQQGKNAWEKLLDQYKRKLRGFEDEKKLKTNILKLGYKTMEEFHYGIASKSVKTSLYLLKKLYPEAFSQTERSAKTRSRSGKAFEPQVLVEGVGSIETKFAKCCNPIKGEPIIAYITKKSELKIHSVDCPYLKSVELDRSNFKKAEWMIGTDSLQLVRLRIYSDSYSKALSVTADTAEDEKIKIISTLKFETRTNEEGLLIEAEVKDINQLERFIGKLKISPAVRSVQNV